MFQIQHDSTAKAKLSAYDKAVCCHMLLLSEVEQGAIPEASFHDRHVDMLCLPCIQTQTQIFFVMHVIQTSRSYF